MKKRLDLVVVEKGYITGRDKAKAVIMSGDVYVNGQKADKAGMLVDEDLDKIEVRAEKCPFVSRGGYKLVKAMDLFPIDLQNTVCADIGASTGGFTDCMLQKGASKVYSIDVGYGQLAWKLRTDERVVNLERTNIRYVTDEQIPDKIDFISVDVSFISLTLVLPVVHRLLTENGKAVCLVKPQFEAGKGLVGKKGVVRDPQVHRDVIEKVVTFAREQEFFVSGLTFSPIKGPEGNIEYLMYITKADEGTNITDEDFDTVVKLSHSTLDL